MYCFSPEHKDESIKGESNCGFLKHWERHGLEQRPEDVGLLKRAASMYCFSPEHKDESIKGSHLRICAAHTVLEWHLSRIGDLLIHTYIYESS